GLGEIRIPFSVLAVTRDARVLVIEVFAERRAGGKVVDLARARHGVANLRNALEIRVERGYLVVRELRHGRHRISDRRVVRTKSLSKGAGEIGLGPRADARIVEREVGGSD